MSVHNQPRNHTSHRVIERLAALGFGTLVAAAIGCTSTTAKTAKTPTPSPDAKSADILATVQSPPPPASAKPVVASAPKGPQANVLSSTIRNVTVYSDRARVTRRATAAIGPKPTVYAFKALPGWVDDGSVRVSTSLGRIVDVRVSRNYLARATDPAYLQAEEALQALTNRMAALTDEMKVLDAQSKQIENIKAFSLEKVTKDTTIGDISVESYGRVVAFISKSLRETAKARRTVLIERTKLQPEIDAAQRRLNELKGLTQLEETMVLVALEHTAKADSVIEITYMLPGATWEPMHELRVSKLRPQTVEVASFAVITQTSGEDWNHADITFSTQSSTETVRIPALEALTLGDAKTATQMIERRSASFSRAQSAFDSQNMMWNKMQQKSAYHHNFEETYRSNYDYLQVVQSKTVQLFQSLQKRGTTAHFKAINTANVRADGHSVRLPIGRSQLSATQKIVAAPEQSLNAAVTLDMLNASAQAFLPGKVSLYQDGAFLGMTDIDFIAEGERFALFLRVADHIKLTRVLDKKQSSIVRKKRTRMQVAFLVSVENLSDKSTSLTLADRIPVSENKQIAISRVKINPAVKPDSKGILYWPLTLEPKQKQAFSIQYQIEYPPTLILDMKRKRRPMRSPSRRQMNKPKMYNLEEDIIQLESDL